VVLPPPNKLLGIDGPYDEWYPAQDEAVDAVLKFLKGSKRVMGLSAPTGAGKSVIAMCAAKLSDRRTVYLTSTKGLQNQIYGDFSALGMSLIMGQNSYQCIAEGAQDGGFVSADEGPCREGWSCPHKGMGCPYYDKLRQALQSGLVVTNYHYYLAQTYYTEEGLGDIDLLICDEAHLTWNAMESHLSLSLKKGELENTGCHYPEKGFAKWSEWRKWAQTQRSKAAELATRYKAEINELRDSQEDVPPKLRRAFREATSLERKLDSLGSSAGDWVWERKSYTERSGVQVNVWEMSPIWVATYTYPRLFRNVPKIVCMSAVLTEKTMRILGVLQDEMEFLEMPSYFPKENNPIYHVPTVRMNRHTTEDEMKAWVSRIDQIIGRRLDRKGIIFTVSYERARLILANSKYADVMITHQTRNITEQIRKFKRSEPPKVLVSPAVTTGFDFPGRECSYAIVGKVPYPDTRDLVTQARQDIDPTWTSWMAMDTLVQECGRGFRGPDDFLEVIVIDDSVSWYWRQYKGFAPEWFRERYLGRVAVIPEPPSINGKGGA